jgi:hypothetical protein
MRTRPSLWVLPLALGATLFGARAAYARDCAVDSDCPRGYACTGTTASADGGLSGTCSASTCQTDSDCAPAFRCEIDAYTQCVGSECSPASVCQPQYDVPCETDSDCGPGFACSGSAGGYNCGAHQDAGYPYGTTMTVPCADVPKPPLLPSPDSGFNIPPICQPGSTCTANTYKTCESQAPGSCEVDSDCPSTWTCACEQGGFGGGGDVLLPADADASCAKTCLAPNSDLGIYGENGAGATFGPAGTGVGDDAGAASTPSLGDDTPKAAPAAPHASDSEGGCAVGGGNAGAEWFWAPLGGLVVAFRRRSRQRA